ncbi:MAG TPA: hypothetical protein PK559_03140 [Ignavibacteriaceae bacterium]|nr:hypothetical protein [Ignavibacteriaceae bacterium]
MKNILLILLFLSISVSVLAYSGGDGSSGTPYQISSASDLIELSNTSGDWDKFFIQTVDISYQFLFPFWHIAAETAHPVLHTKFLQLQI